MTEQEFVDYIKPFGTHVSHIFGEDVIIKKWHVNFDKEGMGFEINGKKATPDECANLISSYKRNEKLNDLGIK